MPESPPRAVVALLAAGTGQRVGADTNKVLLPLDGLPVFACSLRWIQGMERVAQVVVVLRDQDREFVGRTLGEHFPDLEVTLVTGGSTRHGSELNALTTLAGAIDAEEIDVVAIHDAARPLAGTDLFASVIEAAAEYGGALPVREQSALVPRDPVPTPRVSGARLVGVQTPQAFRAQPLLEAYRHAARDGFVGTDTASCVEKYAGLEIHCVPGAATNLKITYPEDVALAGRLLDKLGGRSDGPGRT